MSVCDKFTIYLTMKKSKDEGEQEGHKKGREKGDN